MDFLANTCTIVTQPKQNFHFRYASELKNTHGVITGQQQQQQPLAVLQNNSEETFPTIKLQLPANGHLDDCGNKRDFYVLCSLHCYAGEARSLSPHLLMKKGETRVNHDFIFEKMDESNDDPLARTWQLKNYVIVRLKTEEYVRSLQEKRAQLQSLQLPLEFEQLKGELDMDKTASVKNSGVLNVCLGFTIFERDFYADTYRLYKETVHSVNIYHGDDLKIHQLCNTKGSIAGNIPVHILIKLQSGYSYNVHMFRSQGNGNGNGSSNGNGNEIDWEETIPVSNDEIFSNAAITFTLPRGPYVEDRDEIEVMLEVVVDSSSYRSQTVKFSYLNNVEETVRRKRARVDNIDPYEGAAAAAGAAMHQQEEVSDELAAIDPHDMHINNSSSSDSGESSASAITSDFAFDFGNIDFFDIVDVPPESLDIYISRDKVVPAYKELGTIKRAVRRKEPVTAEARMVNRIDIDFSNIVDVAPESRDICISRDKVVPADKELGTIKRAVRRKEPVTAQARMVNRISSILNLTQKDKDIHIVRHNDHIGNTLFHDAIMDETTLATLYRHMQTTQHRQLVLKARNNLRHNLLHYACYRNRAASIRPLVGMGCGLHQQDYQGRTPLHIAIERHHSECIGKIQDLLEDYSDYGADLEKHLIQMFKVYNDRGHTVLHAAVLENLPELLEVMLEFCRQHKVDILQYEVLGNGDSLVHLMVKRNRVDMIDLIKRYVPLYLSVQNYPGQTVLDIEDLSLEMFEALKLTDD